MTNGNQALKGPLDGIRVIDWTMWQFGPVSTMMLADMGADVIKVESLDGDHGRQFGRVGGVASETGGGTSAYFDALNRNKRGIALDLKNPRGQKIMHQLVEKADVFVENFRQGVAERLGMGYEDLQELNPKIIYGSATGYGPNGPDSGKPAFALTGEARAGSLWWAGPDDGVPYNITGMADQIAGIMLSYGILGAVISRERFGFGQRVDASHLGSLMWLGGMRDGIILLAKKEMERQSRTNTGNILWNCYKCKDDKWIAFSMSQGDRYWPTVCKGMNRLDLIEDPRFNSMETRDQNRTELIGIMDEVFATKTRDEWAVCLDEAGDLIWENVQSALDLPNDPQVQANGYIAEIDHPVLGPSHWLQTPIGYDKTPLLSTQRLAPAHGENTEEILIDELGYDWEDVASLQQDGVIL